MSTIYIQIPWHDSDEYIDVDLDRLPEHGDALDTLDYWRGEDERVRYVARCMTASVADGVLTLKLRYLPEDNEHIAHFQSAWGYSAIVINLDKRNGVATWCDSADKSRDGDVSCRILDDSISNDVSYKNTRSIDRLGQAFLRETLLQRFGRCALTGEETWAVLDVAHLIAARSGGAASIKNCILLRSDIHRLMDKGLLSIGRDGRADLRKEAGARYQRELANTSLSVEVLACVRRVLAP